MGYISEVLLIYANTAKSFFKITVHACVLSHFSRVQLFVTPWTVATRLLCPWDSPSKNTGVGCHDFFQVISLIQGLNLQLLRLLHCRQILYPLSPLGSPKSQYLHS